MPAEGLGVALQGTELHPVPGELRDEGDVHPERLPGHRHRAVYVVGRAARGEFGQPVEPARVGRSVGRCGLVGETCAVRVVLHNLLPRRPGRPCRAKARGFCAPASRRVCLFVGRSSYTRNRRTTNVPLLGLTNRTATYSTEADRVWTISVSQHELPRTEVPRTKIPRSTGVYSDRNSAAASGDSGLAKR